MNETLNKLENVVRVKLAPTNFNVGVVAMRDIAKGTRLEINYPRRYYIPYEHFKKLSKPIHDYLLERWGQIVNGSAFFYPDAFFQCYMNHSDTPNYDAFNDLTIKDIIRGEEITHDYKIIPNYKETLNFLNE